MTLPDPNTLDWGNMSKAEFKRNELAYELAHEEPQFVKQKLTARTIPLKTVPLTDALAVAYAAYRINGNAYIKDTRRFSCDENKTQFDNKSLVPDMADDGGQQTGLLDIFSGLRNTCGQF